MHRWESNVKMDLEEIYENVGWINLYWPSIMAYVWSNWLCVAVAYY
jgi:hypothetical protein